jgi:CHAT domain-containing protein/Tfp pilus assembly protein PilF
MNRRFRFSFRRLFFFLGFNLAVAVVTAQNYNEPNQGANNFDGLQNLTSVDSRRRALSELIAVRDRQRGTHDVTELIRTINRIGELHLKQHDLKSALADATESLALARQSTNGPLLVNTLILSARVHLYRQNNLTGVRLLNEAHMLSLRTRYRHGEAQSLAELGVAYFQQSDLSEAEKCNDEALKIWRELQDQRGEARTLTSQGEAYMLQDKAEPAASVLRSAETIWRMLGDSTELAKTLIDLNFLAIRQGQWEEALSSLSEAQLIVNDEEAEPYLAGQIAASFGEVYEAYGQLDTALSYFRKAAALYRDSAHDIAAAIDVSSKAGRVLARIGDYVDALKQIEQALQLAQGIDDELRVGLCREDLGRVFLAAGLYEQARQEFLRSIIHYQRTKSRRAWARAQTFLGQTEYSQGRLAEASRSYHRALQVFQSIQDYTNEAALCFGLGKVELQQQQLEEAGNHLKRSIALTEQLRENAASKDLRSSFLASVHDRYETYVEWLMQLHARQPEQGFDILAFEASESGRARSLLDSLRDYERELRQVAKPALLLEEEKLQKEEQQLLDKRSKLQSEGGAHEAREKVESELIQIRARYETLEAEINTTAKFKNLMRPAPLGVAEIKRQITDPDTTLLEYSLGSQESYLWVITPEGLTTYILPGKNTIENVARKLADLLAKPQTEPGQEAELEAAIKTLSRLILAPVAGKLHSSRLIIVPDGILQYVPFQILTVSSDVKEPLVADFEIVNSPSASTLAVVQQENISRPSATKLIAAFGDPVFSSNYSLKGLTATRGQTGEVDLGSQQHTQAGEDAAEETFDPAKLQPLFFAKRELNELRKLAPADESAIYSDFAATRDNLRKLDLGQFRILHLATHGLLNARQPELSGLVLSLVDRDGHPVSGFVGLSDIYNLSAQVDLVVLSACRTALGKEVRGEGLVGLTRGFMYAGASSVVASLWKVDDEATAELMKRFYSNMLQSGMTPASALRAAQNSIRQEPQWHSPYYWAAFTLQGEYRHVIKSPRANAIPTYQRIIAVVGFLALLAGAALSYLRHRRMRTAQRTDAIRQ